MNPSFENTNIQMDQSCDLVERYLSVRSFSEEICRPLEIEDYVVQPSHEVSPPKWHLAHTTWFFEELILKKFKENYIRFNEEFPLLFNSYYKSAGEHWLQSERGQLSRPRVSEIFEYRKSIDDQLIAFLKESGVLQLDDLVSLLEVGLHHEQQHQELLLMDIKKILGTHPGRPSYTNVKKPQFPYKVRSWQSYPEALYQIGASEVGFSYDNEGPEHKVYLYPFAIADTLVSNSEFLEFIEDGGYKRPELWLSKGWDWVQAESVNSPLYWSFKNNQWFEYTLYGNHLLDPNAAVTHISYFEADAFANWKGLRLPTEEELEIFLKPLNFNSNKVQIHPQDLTQKVNSVWCWTRSHFSAYPGYKKFAGMIEEYNGKFMCNQFVLKGGCVATSEGHNRSSYRNFYEPHQRWMFSGLRLARDE